MSWQVRQGRIVAFALLVFGVAGAVGSDAAQSPRAVAEAVAHQDHQALRSLLAKGADPNLPDREGFTPLIIAAERNDVVAATMLLHSGANPHLYSDPRGAPLDAAANYDSLEVASLLLRAGVKPDEYSGLALACAASHGSLKVAKLLLKHGAKVDYPGRLPTALGEAVITSQCEMVKLLIESRANVWTKLRGGATLARVAEESEHADLRGVFRAALSERQRHGVLRRADIAIPTELDLGWCQTNGNAGRTRYRPALLHSPSLIAEVDAAGSNLLADDRSLFIDQGHGLIAVDLATGHLVWSRKLPFIILCAIDRGVLICRTGEGTTGFKTTDGDRVFMTYGERPHQDNVFLLQPRVVAMPRLVRTVKHGDNVEKVYYVERDAGTGRVRAVRHLPIPPDSEAYDYAEGGMGAFGANNSLLLGVNYLGGLGRGVSVWNRATGKRLAYRHYQPRVNAVAAQGRNVYVLLNGAVMELNERCEKVWKQPLKRFPSETEKEFFVGTLAVAPDYVVVGWDNAVICFERKTGKRLWTFQLPAPERLAERPEMVVCGDRVYVAAGTTPLGDPHQSLIGLDLATGKVASTLPLSVRIVSSLGASGRYLFATAIAENDGRYKTVIFSGQP